MQTHWFYAVWPFIGLGGAIVMIAILLTTDTFRGSTMVSRWRDPVWLAWLAVPLYWIHQFEEYSLPVIGLDYSIQEMICKNLGFPPYPDCPIPLAFYPVVNIALMWFGAPLAAYRCRRNVLIGLSHACRSTRDGAPRCLVVRRACTARRRLRSNAASIRRLGRACSLSSSPRSA